MKRYCARDFSSEELQQIRHLIEDNPGFHRAELSRKVCRMLQWFKPDGGLKQMSCRVAMLRMHENGLIQLPPPRRAKAAARPFKASSLTDPEESITQAVHQLGSLQLQLVDSKNSSVWNEYIERYHYLGYTPLPGAQLRYFVTANGQTLALLGFAAAAWQTAPRDQFIGWNRQQRERNLHYLVNNARFLILPWVQSKNLASKILGMTARQLPDDWENRYRIRPVLMESFVETNRFTGTCYKAANWIFVGKTKGRGKLGPSGKQSVPIKDIWLYPLHRRFRSSLIQ
jgi:Druantia protein DruA